jgi:hypothetical protein
MQTLQRAFQFLELLGSAGNLGRVNGFSAVADGFTRCRNS